MEMTQPPHRNPGQETAGPPPTGKGDPPPTQGIPQPQPGSSGNQGVPTPAQQANPGPTTKPPLPRPGDSNPPSPSVPPSPDKVVGTLKPLEILAKPTTLVVSRLPRDRNGTTFASLAEACGAALPNQETIIEIRDNGPLFETPVQINGRRIVIRPAKSYRPLLAWDVQPSSVARSPYLFTVNQGVLRLENLDLVLKYTETGQTGLGGLIQVENGELWAESCTVSASGHQRSDFAVVQLGSGACKCRLDRCYLRGADLRAVSAQAPQADIMLRGCLVVGGNRPVLDVLGKSGTPGTSLRIAQSTLVAGQTMLRVRPVSPADKEPAIRLLAWDTLLARFGTQTGGELLALEQDVRATNISWEAVNCLYAGWQTLLRQGEKTIAANDLNGWHAQWQQKQGDMALEPTWPAVVDADPSDTPPAVFRTTGHVAYAGTAGASSLGCDLAALPPVREKWLWLTYERFAAPDYFVPSADQAPEIPTQPEGLFHGGQLDVSTLDLGVYLREKVKPLQAGPRIVMHLYGKGKAPTSPIRIKGASLVLYFEPSQKEEDRPYLVPANAADKEAWIEVEDGNLDVLGGSLRYPNVRGLALPSYLLKVTGGDLRISGCELRGPLGQASSSYQGLIQFVGTGGSPAIGAWSADQAPIRECAIMDSVLLSGRNCIHSGSAGTRVRLTNCVAVAAGDLLHLNPNPAPTPRQRAQCILDHDTIAARRAVVGLQDAGSWTPPVEPVLLQARSDVFLAPFGAVSPPTALLLFEGEALAHGLVVWQEEGSVYDKRIRDYAALEQGATSPAAQQEALWTRLWGPAGERRPFVREWPTGRSIDLDNPKLERLVLPPTIRQQIKGRPPGADVEQLGLLKKSVTGPRNP
jgi:hypothetical protein